MTLSVLLVQVQQSQCHTTCITLVRMRESTWNKMARKVDDFIHKLGSQLVEGRLIKHIPCSQIYEQCVINQIKKYIKLNNAMYYFREVKNIIYIYIYILLYIYIYI